MTSLFDRIFGRSRENSASMAKERLQFVLVHDRVNLPPDQLKAMKQEILAVISKYVNVSDAEVDIAMQQRDRHSNLLVAEVPFSNRVIIDPDEDEAPQSKYLPEDGDFAENDHLSSTESHISDTSGDDYPSFNEQDEAPPDFEKPL
jgi:cell division topological specificity factor